MGSVSVEVVEGIGSVLTPLLTGPTHGLMTVLILILAAGWGAMWKVLPAWREAAAEQARVNAAQTAVLTGIQVALEALTAQVNATNANLSQRLDRVEVDLEDLSKEIRKKQREQAKAA